MQNLTTNLTISDRLRAMADLLQAQGANPFRANAYRRAADAVARLPEDLGALFDRDGVDGLDAITGVGRGIASAIAEMLITGRWGQLERLRGTIDPEQVFQTVPGIGAELARRIHDSLHVDTLEALETAAHDGRLGEVPGIGPRRPLLRDIDREYREKAEAGRLALHGALLQHRQGARARHDPGLGGHLLLPRRPSRGRPAHRGHGNPRSPGRPAGH